MLELRACGAEPIDAHGHAVCGDVSAARAGGRGGAGGAPRARSDHASNSVLSLTALAIESHSGELESLPAPSNPWVFLPF